MDNSFSNLEEKLKKNLNRVKKEKASIPEREQKSFKYETSGKRKLTFYMTQSCEGMLNELYTSKLLMGEKIDKSSLICEAIELLFKKFKGV